MRVHWMAKKHEWRQELAVRMQPRSLRLSRSSSAGALASVALSGLLTALVMKRRPWHPGAPSAIA